VCHREQGPWTCEVVKERTAKFELTFAGNTASHEFELPLWLEVDDARRLLAHASERWSTLINSQQCGWKPDPDKPDEGQQKVADGVPFKPEWPGFKKIVDQPHSVLVIIDSTSMEFVLSPDHNDWRFVCWGGWVEVS
jgi:hypothetical protein